MPSVSPITKSPVAQFLSENHAIAKRDKGGCDFFTKEGLYLGRLSKSVVGNYTVYKTTILGNGLKTLFSKSVALGQQLAYFKNNQALLGVSILPLKTLKREVLVDFINKYTKTKDTETFLLNKLELIAQDETTGVGLYEADGKFKYNTKTVLEKMQEIKHPKFKFVTH